MCCGKVGWVIAIGIGIGAAMGSATHHMGEWLLAGGFIAAGLGMLFPQPCAVRVLSVPPPAAENNSGDTRR